MVNIWVTVKFRYNNKWLTFVDVVVTVYGSSVTGFALKESDINMDVNSENAARMLATLHLIFKDDQSGGCSKWNMAHYHFP